MKQIGEVVKPWLNRGKRMALAKEFEQIMQHPLLQAYIREHPEIPLSVYKHSVNALKQWLTEKENCQRCPGLDTCPNMMKGHFTKLVDELGYLEFRMQPCRKWKVQQEMFKVQSLIRSYHIPKDVLESSFETLDYDMGRIHAIDAAIDFCNQFANGKPKKGLYLYGPFGVGKSRIAGAIMNEIIQYKKSSYMVYLPDFMRDISDSIHENNLSEKVDFLKKVDVLILDDIGAEYLTPWKRDEILGAVLHYRYAERLPTVFTSNMSLDQLEEHLAYSSKGNADWMKAKRIMERIRHYVIPLAVNGPNRRESLSN
ncbi:primosomal protein DnaI [Thermoflavimicrobium dichotomicum]|uniref:Primosomal protein DnaI n=1 Tax=Thermoflavimicrobium dichotomicum TaxID=46223 RepID=A0A1I3L9I2_9BACL|nr:primosomal protein DnaI [Thermoflavimicrobium dichotomicum]SFI81339.1 primosomal protein DnaI [Thermoflavimicrobium dichotomicum]